MWRSHVLISSTVSWPSPSLSPPASMTRSTRVSWSPCVLRPSTIFRADLSSALEIFPSPSTSRAASSAEVISPSPSTSSQPRILRQISCGERGLEIESEATDIYMNKREYYLIFNIAWCDCERVELTLLKRARRRQ